MIRFYQLESVEDEKIGIHEFYHIIVQIYVILVDKNVQLLLSDVYLCM